MNPTTRSSASATMPMQFRCRRHFRKSSSVQQNSKLSRSVRRTSVMSRRIIHRMWVFVGAAVAIARPVLMRTPPPVPGRGRNRAPPPFDPARRAAGVDPHEPESTPAEPPRTTPPRLLLVEPGVLFLRYRRLDLRTRHLHRELVVPGHRPLDPHPEYGLPLHVQLRHRVESHDGPLSPGRRGARRGGHARPL